MSWKPMSVEQDVRVDAISPAVLSPEVGAAHFTVFGANLPADPVVWMYWQGQPVLKATVLSKEDQGGRSVLKGEVDLTGWETDRALALRVLVGSRDGSHGVWCEQELTLKTN